VVTDQVVTDQVETAMEVILATHMVVSAALVEAVESHTDQHQYVMPHLHAQNHAQNHALSHAQNHALSHAQNQATPTVHQASPSPASASHHTLHTVVPVPAIAHHANQSVVPANQNVVPVNQNHPADQSQNQVVVHAVMVPLSLAQRRSTMVTLI